MSTSGQDADYRVQKVFSLNSRYFVDPL